MIKINGKEYKIYSFDEIDRNKYIGFIYVTVNLVNGKKYVGQHTSWNNKYLGSGIAIKKAINKYGKENFKRYIIDVASTQEMLNKLETYYINKAFGINTAKDENWYNIKDGSQNGCSEEWKERLRKINKDYWNNLDNDSVNDFKKKVSFATKEAMRNNQEKMKEAVRKKSGKNHYMWNGYITVVDFETGEAKHFMLQNEVSKYLKLAQSKVSEKLKTGKLFKDRYKIMYKKDYLENSYDYRKDEEYKKVLRKRENNKEKIKIKKEIILYDLDSKKSFVFDKLQDCADYLGCAVSTVYNRIKDGKVYNNKYKFSKNKVIINLSEAS